MTPRPAAGAIWRDDCSQHVNRVKDMITRRAFGALALAFPVVTATRFATTETPVKAEKNPPGDIPDDQVFITYASPLGFALKVPEGWARIDRADGVIFADKYGKIEVALTTGDLPTPKTAADAVKASLHAVDVKKAETTDRPAGRAIYVAFGLQFRAQRRHQQADTPGTFGRRERDRGDLSALHEQVAIVFQAYLLVGNGVGLGI